MQIGAHVAREMIVLTARGRERETGSAHIELARHDSQWQLASLNLVADP